MIPPAAKRPEAARPVRGSEVDRVLHLAARLFDVGAAVLVLAGPDGLRVETASTAAVPGREGALDAACRLFELLAAAEGGAPRAGVLEEVVPGRGFVAATPVLSRTGRCLGALCLLDGGRHTLLGTLQRRLFAEFGDLVASALGGAPAAAATLQGVADAAPEAFALFDPAGRCLLRNRRFDALLGTAGTEPTVEAAVEPGNEAAWLARHLARDIAPVGVYRAALADGTWLSVEERRGPHGRSLLARVETRDAFGSAGDDQMLFERCPLPMFVFHRDTRAILAANAAALTLYGWDRDGFLGLDIDSIGAVEPGAGQGWTHRRRDGRPITVSGRAVGLDHGGRPAVLVTVTAGAEDVAA